MASTRERIVTAGAELFRRHGYTGTGVKQIVTRAEAPFGSLYHFFPGGKEQLGAEVIREAGLPFAALFDIYIASADSLVDAIEGAFAGAAETLVETDYADACPIATIALEVASSNENLRQATAEVFEAWLATGTRVFGEFGLSADDARRLAIATVTSLEGAFVLSRSLRSTEPLLAAGRTVAALARELQ
ncbi:TetR family transcriptional regulator [Saccharomonospora sp. CUA-673]|uniref:TetR/AcrR family transcriptional regulator n=1 Tax=Saccharomonospora sp. CUA-673 TaxID=1904969 RepID=UPI000962555B|nr:TetR/AcrR family transcriptional regulator [Saccharomonospora sp. CUA-673]OLT47876.1 TetR family transcriptional regulator [Saccharomonospora sp. CUA-673]